MNYDELNEYIKHYIEKDKTKSAIMLTGAWGTGKSYYIRNYLEPFLKENDHRCATVSLYGLKSLSEISKNIYFELRSIGFSKKSEAKTTGGVAAMIVGKTILNGLTSKIGFDIGSISDEDLEKVYSSINLSGVLVILEDLERSNINIIDVLGYINSLVEQDGVKVLLVANEDEILKYYDSQPDKDGKTHKIADEKTAMYLKAKEKTISDTILFDGDLKSAIKVIISSFENRTLNTFTTVENISDILEIMYMVRNYNLRSFMFACQKTVDIFEKLENLVSTEDIFLKNVFYGIIAFSMRIKNGDFPSWNTDGLFSIELGSIYYPLYDFCYDYIRWHKIDVDDIQKKLSEYKTLRLFHKFGIKKDNDLNIIFYFYLHNEREVMSALKNIEKRLDDAEDIPFYNYEKLVYYLIQCKSVLCFDYSLCKKEMINNIRLLCQSEEKKTIFSFWSVKHFDFENEEGKKQFLDFTKEITNALHFTTNPNNIFKFSYSPNILNELYDFVARNNEEFSNKRFISKFDLNKLVKMIFECNPEQLQDFRGMLLSIYRDSFKKDSLDDCIFMEELKSKLESTIKSSPSMDKIQLLQINYLIDNLEQFISQLS